MSWSLGLRGLSLTILGFIPLYSISWWETVGKEDSALCNTQNAKNQNFQYI